MNNSKNVGRYLFGAGALKNIGALLADRRVNADDHIVFFVDEFFEQRAEARDLPVKSQDKLIFVQTKDEPTTDYIDHLTDKLRSASPRLPVAIVGMGGGITLDTAKAVSNLLTNGGKAADYQGWDLVKRPGVYKIGIPTVSGTGAEASRTCVMMNVEKNLKLGMNSEHTIYDQLVLDPDLTRTVPRDQYFYSGMDSYVHCIESLAGRYRHVVGDAFSHQSLNLVKEVFEAEDMMATESREKLMVASYLGGCAIANSYVGVVHPFSAGLSVVLKMHHCIANCIVMNQMEDFYPSETEEFHRMLKKQRISLPKGLCADLTEEQYEKLYLSTVIHEKPLSNALGGNYRDTLTKARVIELFKRM